MTKLEKDYEKALAALKFISRDDVSFNREGHAAKVYAELTAKEYEVMKRFICPKCEKVYGWQEDCCGVETVDFSYSRPVEEKEEVLEGKITYLLNFPNRVKYSMIDRLPPEWIGKIVEVRLKGE